MSKIFGERSPDIAARKVTMSRDFYMSEEFQALCKKFGIAWGLKTRDMCIYIEMDGIVTIYSEYLASEEKEDVNDNNTKSEPSSPDLSPRQPIPFERPSPSRKGFKDWIFNTIFRSRSQV